MSPSRRLFNVLALVTAVPTLFAVLILTGLLPTFGDGQLSDVEKWTGWALVAFGSVMIVFDLHNARLCTNDDGVCP